MLNELAVQRLGPIESAEIVLDRGSSALTGETGAGKTLLVSAVSLLLGGRADRSMIRDGDAEALVEGRFLIPRDHPAVELLVARDLLAVDSDEIEVVVSRAITPSGSKARINGRLVPVATLSEIGALLVEIVGQHEHQRLASARFQRTVLDRFAGAEDLAAEVATSVRDLMRTRRRLEELRAGERERARELEMLKLEIAEIEGAALRIGEAAELTLQAQRLEHAEAISRSIGAALDALRGEGGAEELLATARREFDDAGTHDETFVTLAARLETAGYEIADVAAEAAVAVPDPDPAALASVRDRLGLIGRLRRKYGDSEDEVLGYLATAQARVKDLEGDAVSIDDLVAATDRLTEDAETKARALSTARTAAAPGLAETLQTSLAELAMSGAVIDVELTPCDLYEGGLEQVRLSIATGPGEQPKPVTKIASGGELSRIGLALHLLSSGDPVPTLIFDEIDAGVGGEAARAVGRALTRLARGGVEQVLVVTHLPQVAAATDAQFRVRRIEGDRRGVAVERVDGDDRVEELSRMLAGLPESDRARQHAHELLELAAAETT